MKKITLERVVHEGESCLSLSFPYDNELIDLVKTLPRARWEPEGKYWHVPDSNGMLYRIENLFEGHALTEFRISGLGGIEAARERSSPVSDSGSKSGLIPEEELGYGPVVFTINEEDGRLAVKFGGHFDRDWIRELREYGKPDYDPGRKEWYMGWSQFMVDSLADFFSSRGVEVIVRKAGLTDELLVARDLRAREVGSRVIGSKAEKYIKLVVEYLEASRYSTRTVDSYRSHLGLFFRYFSDRDPESISSEDTGAFLNDHIIRLGYSASYQNLMVSAIKVFFRVARGEAVDTGSVMRARKGRALPKVLSKEEVMKVFSVTRNSKHKLILWMIYACGLRRSEVINIKLQHLDRGRGVLLIREGKGNVDRVVPVPQKIWEKVGLYLKVYNPVTYLFEGQGGGKYSAESVYSIFKQAMKRAGIRKDVGVHCLRHSFATHLHEGGLDIRYIQELLGHRSSRTTEIYTHVSRRDLISIRSPIEDMDLE
ncbi:MAG: site-specific integrase [Bacteroidales bacterium]|jgi:site-specific recombinase XerD|nr:site-specific integrase [Bacteroidales bacterium]